MQISIYRDYAALRFIRCTTPLPGGGNAGAAAMTLPAAVRKCESEYAERVFQRTRLHPHGIGPVGIAAHTDRVAAVRHAADEATETLCLHAIREAGQFRCFRLRHSPRFKCGVARTSDGFFAFVIAELNGIPFGVYSAAPTLGATLLKTWEEYRNVMFFRPEPDDLATFTKANKLFTQNELRALPFVFDARARLPVDVTAMDFFEAEFQDRHVAYYLYPKTSKKESL